MRYFWVTFLFLVVVIVAMLGFRGQKSENEPLYIFPDMDWQPRYHPQGKNDFFANQRDDRGVIAGTVVRGHAWDMVDVFSPNYDYPIERNPELYTGKVSSGAFVNEIPLEITHEFMAKGKEKYEIFCQVCHGATGDGNGITKQYGMVATATYHADRLRTMPDGEIFNTITHGKGQMLPYADKLSPEERWSTVLYVRALQRAQNASIEDVPQAMRSELSK